MTAMARVEAEIRARGESLSAFAARIGVRSQDINNWKKRGIPRTRQRLVADALGWTLDDLLIDDATGSFRLPDAPGHASAIVIAEPVIGDQASAAIPEALSHSSAPSDLPTDRSVLIPRRRILLSAGSRELVLAAETPPLVVDPDWLRRIGLSAEHAAVLYAQGDSMAPLIREGDVLLVDLSDRALHDGRIFAIRYAHELRVRRLFRRYDGWLILRTENRQRYPDETVPPLDHNVHIEIIGRVLWRGGQI